MSTRARQLSGRRGAHRTRRGPIGVLLVVIGWVVVVAVVLALFLLAARRVMGPLLDLAGRVG